MPGDDKDDTEGIIQLENVDQLNTFSPVLVLQYETYPRSSPSYQSIDHNVRFDFESCQIHLRRPIVVFIMHTVDIVTGTRRLLLNKKPKPPVLLRHDGQGRGTLSTIGHHEPDCVFVCVRLTWKELAVSVHTIQDAMAVFSMTGTRLGYVMGTDDDVYMSGSVKSLDVEDTLERPTAWRRLLQVFFCDYLASNLH
jgi:hypothetical protein